MRWLLIDKYVSGLAFTLERSDGRMRKDFEPFNRGSIV